MVSWKGPRWSLCFLRIGNFPLPWFILSSGNYSLRTCLGMKIFWPPHLFILSSEFGMLFGSSCGRSEPHTPLIGLGRRNIGFVPWVSFSSSDISLICWRCSSRSGLSSDLFLPSELLSYTPSIRPFWFLLVTSCNLLSSSSFLCRPLVFFSFSLPPSHPRPSLQ